MHVCPLQYSSHTLPATQSKPGLLADKLSEVQMSYFYLCLCVCQYLWIIKFLEWAYRKKWGIWGGIFIDWDIEGSLFVWFYYVFRLYSTYICQFANQTGWAWVSDSGHYLTTGFPHAPLPPICQYDRTINDCHTSGRFDPPFSWEMPVPSREYDSCFLVSHLVMS